MGMFASTSLSEARGDKTVTRSSGTSRERSIAAARFAIEDVGALGTMDSTSDAVVQPRIEAAVATVTRERANLLGQCEYTRR